MKRDLLAALLLNLSLLAVRQLHDVLVFASQRPAGAGAGLASQNGDVNADGARDISDAIYLLSWLFSGGPEPVACAGGAPDGNLDSRVAALEETVYGCIREQLDDLSGGQQTCRPSGADADCDLSPSSIDCNDADPTTYPGARELCDGIADEGIDVQVDSENCGRCGRRCLPGSHCVNGECTEPTGCFAPGGCDDGDPLTFDCCDLANNCQHVPNDLCDDHNPCTEDLIAIPGGIPECVNQFVDGAPCEGGICSQGNCVPQ